MRRLGWAGAATALLAVATACTGSPEPPAPSPPPQPLAWTPVELPHGAVPLLVRAGRDDVLVAARTGDLASMFRLTVPGPGSVEPASVDPVPVEPHSVYAPTARWVDLATDGQRVLALGRASGGAHGLPRWTIWDGTPTRLVERPQPFETFGGPRSGGLAAVGAGRADVLVGTWDDGGPGLDTRLWTHPSARTWERVPAAAHLASTGSELPQPSAVAWSASGLLVVGSVTVLGGAAAVATRAAAWTGPGPAGPWTRHDLPATTSSARATAVACDGDRCWVVGLDGGHPAAWLVAGSTVSRLDLPAVPTVTDVPPALALAGATAWVALPGSERVLLARREGSGWVTSEGPPGQPVSLAVTGGGLALVTSRAATTTLATADPG